MTAANFAAICLAIIMAFLVVTIAADRLANAELYLLANIDHS